MKLQRLKTVPNNLKQNRLESNYFSESEFKDGQGDGGYCEEICL